MRSTATVFSVLIGVPLLLMALFTDAGFVPGALGVALVGFAGWSLLAEDT